MADIGLLQICHGCQVELAGRDESSAAPVGTDPARIDPSKIAREPCRVVVRKGVAVTLAVVRVVVPQVEREHALGDADADVPDSKMSVREKEQRTKGKAVSEVANRLNFLPDVHRRHSPRRLVVLHQKY